ncbi:tubulin--tyrosine ligase 12 [Brachionus plicatilis]|uniref:Tubulin--tyrosine ligase 12 n=1 Tax=Brachionus plicatilis TaxID=10195 RepID=A0A3M7Q968_BRAPC|nr:tubulin--tyrosine ligase 12 [Brachionus plicatilis]
MPENLIDELLKIFRDLHQSQLKSCGLPEQYWNSLFFKLKDEVFDAGDYFQICMRVDEDDIVIGYKAKFANENGLKLSDENGVFLIDHAWTYKVKDSRQNLIERPNLLSRLCIMMNIVIQNEEELDPEDVKLQKVEAVLENMWKFNQTYKIFTEKLTDDEREPVWYIMDEFGSSLRHSDDPSIKCSPFYYIPTATMYSIIWPLKDLKNGDELTRDYVYGTRDEKLRRAKLFPWNDEDEDYLEDLEDENCTEQSEPNFDYFNSGRTDEILPSESDLELINISKINLSANSTMINVFSDMKSVQENLTDPKFKFVDDMWKADIIFINKHFKDYKQLREKLPNSLVNQFPYENVVTVKDLLAVVSRRVPDSKYWLPTTYNLSYELTKFICYFNKRESDGLDNHWILKPWNLARSIDTTVTKCLNQIIRSQETGPKIACKYITHPVLFYRHEIDGRVKFDVRYIVLLRSIKPLVIYTYKVFWLRFANK